MLYESMYVITPLPILEDQFYKSMLSLIFTLNKYIDLWPKGGGGNRPIILLGFGSYTKYFYAIFLLQVIEE